MALLDFLFSFLICIRTIQLFQHGTVSTGLAVTCLWMSSDVIRVVSNFNTYVRELLYHLPSEKQRHLGFGRKSCKRVVGSDIAFCGSGFFFLFQKGVTSHGEELAVC